MYDTRLTSVNDELVYEVEYYTKVFLCVGRKCTMRYDGKRV